MSLHDPKFYYSKDYYDREQATLFRRNWVCAGFGHQIPDPGDIAPVTVAGTPLILVRDRDAQASIRVFHNVCRHRGNKLVNGICAGRKMIRCPYHSWVYGLGGKLHIKPHFDGPDSHVTQGEGLWPVNSKTWLDLVFCGHRRNRR